MTLRRITSSCLFSAAVCLVAACTPPQSEQEDSPRRRLSGVVRAEMDRINTAEQVTLPTRPPMPDPLVAPAKAPPSETAQTDEASIDPSVSYDAGLVRIQVLLDRAHMSPGVIDGYDGETVRKAVSEYQAVHGKPVAGAADAALLQALAARDNAPALVAYVLKADDVSGPFVEATSDLEAMSRLERVGYASAAEAVAEKFHMDVDLLKKLNPNVDFTRAGAGIVVANAGGDLDNEVASIEVDKRAKVVRALDAGGAVLAFYPATIGSSASPAPSGDYAVRAVAFDPIYTYDPKRLPSFGKRKHGALAIPAGPNNPVGAVWIALTAESYGIHGAPDPSKVSKTQSHGCVRLTNWDALELGRAVRPGAPVRFHESAPTRTAAAASAIPS